MAFSLRENTNAEFREKIAQLFCGKVFKFKNMIKITYDIKTKNTKLKLKKCYIKIN